MPLGCATDFFFWMSSIVHRTSSIYCFHNTDSCRYLKCGTIEFPLDRKLNHIFHITAQSVEYRVVYLSLPSFHWHVAWVCGLLSQDLRPLLPKFWNMWFYWYSLWNKNKIIPNKNKEQIRSSYWCFTICKTLFIVELVFFLTFFFQF